MRVGVHSGGKRVVINATIDKYEYLTIRHHNPAFLTSRSTADSESRIVCLKEQLLRVGSPSLTNQCPEMDLRHLVGVYRLSPLLSHSSKGKFPRKLLTVDLAALQNINLARGYAE